MPTRTGTPGQSQRACTHVHCNAPASCHWQVKCNQSLFLFVLSFLTPLLLSALVSGFHGALCSIDPDSALIACPSKWNYLDIDIVECSAVSLWCNWWRTALTERPNTISTEPSMINMCNRPSAFIFGDFHPVCATHTCRRSIAGRSLSHSYFHMFPSALLDESWSRCVLTFLLHMCGQFPAFQ